MITAAVSVRASTKRRPAAAAAPTTSRLGPPPGRPNTTLVPASASAVTIAAAPAGAPWPLWVTRGHSSGTALFVKIDEGVLERGWRGLSRWFVRSQNSPKRGRRPTPTGAQYRLPWSYALPSGAPAAGAVRQPGPRLQPGRARRDRAQAGARTARPDDRRAVPRRLRRTGHETDPARRRARR